MIYFEFKRDIFEHLRTKEKSDAMVILLHTISGDCRMGAGIAQKIEDKFHWRSAVLFSEADDRNLVDSDGPWVWSSNNDGWENLVHDILRLSYPVGHIVRADCYYRELVGDPSWSAFDILGLVTKERYWQKPTALDMSKALESLAGYLNGFAGEPITLVMPTIGCGLDRLDWPEVSFLIHKHLGGIENLNVEVCML